MPIVLTTVIRILREKYEKCKKNVDKMSDRLKCLKRQQWDSKTRDFSTFRFSKARRDIKPLKTVNS